MQAPRGQELCFVNYYIPKICCGAWYVERSNICWMTEFLCLNGRFGYPTVYFSVHCINIMDVTYQGYGCHISGLWHLQSHLLVKVDMSVWLQVVMYLRMPVENSYSDQNLIISMKIKLNWGGVLSKVFLCWAVCLHQASPSLPSVSWDQCKIKWPTQEIHIRTRGEISWSKLGLHF